MNILITGGCGFIGSNFIKYWLNSHIEDKIINLDKLTYAGSKENNVEANLCKDYSFYLGDICDYDYVNKLMKEKEIDIVINFAAESHVDNSIINSKDFVQSNIVGVHNLLNCSMENKIKKFIQISTDEVYGSLDLDSKEKFHEESPLRPNSPYAATKTSADLLVRSYCKTYGFPGMITRCSNNYGPNQFVEKLIPLLISNVLEDKDLPIYGDGKNVRDWIYVEDHCSAIEHVLYFGEVGEIYNVGSDEEKENLKIVKIILEKIKNSKSSINFVEDRLGHDRRYAICNEKIKSLGWKPKMDFDKGIQNTIDFYLKKLRRK